MYNKPAIIVVPSQINLLMTQYDPSPGLLFSDFICGNGSQPCVYQGPADFNIVDCNSGSSQQNFNINPASFLFSPDPNNPSAGIINESNEHIPAVLDNDSGSFSGSTTNLNITFDFAGPGQNCIADVQIEASGVLSQQSVIVHLDETFTNIHADPNVVNAVCNATGQNFCLDIDFEGDAAPVGQGG